MPARVSVLVLNYNYGRYLVSALQSVDRQMYSDFDIVVADDGSSDGSLEILRAYPSEITVVTGDHIGLPGNLARGLAACEGELVAFLSADDLWLPNHLALTVSGLDRDPRAALAYSTMQAITEAGDPIVRPPTVRRAPTAHRPAMELDWVARDDLLRSQFIPTQATLLRASAVREVGGIDQDLHYCELDLLVRVTEMHPVVFTGQTTVKYRWHSAGMSRDIDAALRARLALYDKHLGGGSGDDHKRRMVSQAYFKAAYPALMENPTPDSLRAARRYIRAAIRTKPSTAWTRLHITMIAASLGGTLFVRLNRLYAKHLRHSRAKPYLQRLVGRV
jgi:glycosyltransferase involved in cell wall biosynthesis